MEPSVISLQERAVLRLELTVPSTGVWSASGEVEGSTLLDLARSELGPFVGTVTSYQSYGDRTGFLLVGGAGSLGTLCRPQSYRAGSISLPIEDIAQQCGETLADLPADVRSWVVESWVLTELPAGEALDHITDEMGMEWWVSVDGELTIGEARTPAEPTASFELVDSSMEGGVLTLAPADGSEFAVLPPCIVNGKTIHTVRYQLTDGILRALCHYA